MTQQVYPVWDAVKRAPDKARRISGGHGLPVVARSGFVPGKAIPFHKANTVKEYGQWVHFYIHDARYECVWRNPERYLPMFKRFEGVITPDFSLYRELPLAMQLWNTYRNRALARWLEDSGVSIVPNVSWGDERTYVFAFEGIEPGGTVAVSTNGCIRKKDDRYYFKKGLARMVEALCPTTIINYSQTPEDIFGEYRARGISIVAIEHEALAVRRAAWDNG